MTLTALLLKVLAIMLALVASVFLFLCVGYLVSILMPFSLFQGTVLVIGSVLTISAILINIQLFLRPAPSLREIDFYDNDDEYGDEDEDDEDEDEDENEPFRGPSYPVKNANKIGRNAPCPCGSGKKYKYCCGH